MEDFFHKTNLSPSMRDFIYNIANAFLFHLVGRFYLKYSIYLIFLTSSIQSDRAANDSRPYNTSEFVILFDAWKSMCGIIKDIIVI